MDSPLFNSVLSVESSIDIVNDDDFAPVAYLRVTGSASLPSRILLACASHRPIARCLKFTKDRLDDACLSTGSF